MVPGDASASTTGPSRRVGPPKMHVERTSSPLVLRWVCRRHDLSGTPLPPVGSHLSEALGEGTITAISFDDGDLLIAFPDATATANRELLGRIDEAVREAVALPGWSAPREEEPVSIRLRGPRRIT